MYQTAEILIANAMALAALLTAMVAMASDARVFELATLLHPAE